MMYFIIFLAILEKIDFLKDIYVAAMIPHATILHAFIFWLSINLPTFGILFFFYAINKLEQFFPTFFGYTELIRDDDLIRDNQLTLNEIVAT